MQDQIAKLKSQVTKLSPEEESGKEKQPDTEDIMKILQVIKTLHHQI